MGREERGATWKTTETRTGTESCLACWGKKGQIARGWLPPADFLWASLEQLIHTLRPTHVYSLLLSFVSHACKSVFLLWAQHCSKMPRNSIAGKIQMNWFFDCLLCNTFSFPFPGAGVVANLEICSWPSLANRNTVVTIVYRFSLKTLYEVNEF